jgi:protein tyrosine/serine phosphatase
MGRLLLLSLVPALLLACDGKPIPLRDGETVSGETISRPARTHAERIEGEEGVGNVGRMNDGLYRGEQPTREGYALLKEKYGIRTIISFRTMHSSKREVEALGMTYVAMPIHAGVTGSTPPDDEEIRRFFETVLDPGKQPVYLHCAHGKDRTGTMAALYRIEVDGWTPGEAIEEMQAFGYHDIYKDLIAFVRDYEPRGFGKTKAPPPGK